MTSTSGLCLRHELDALDRIRGELTDSQQAAVAWTARQLGVDPDAWLEVPFLFRFAGLSAAANIIPELLSRHPDRGEAWACRTAARELGLPSDLVRNWWRRSTDQAA